MGQNHYSTFHIRVITVWNMMPDLNISLCFSACFENVATSLEWLNFQMFLQFKACGTQRLVFSLRSLTDWCHRMRHVFWLKWKQSTESTVWIDIVNSISHNLRNLKIAIYKFKVSKEQMESGLWHTIEVCRAANLLDSMWIKSKYTTNIDKLTPM